VRSIKEYFVLLLKGIAMGSADVVPGVSGGTIAFITGIYDELLNSIKSVDGTAFKLLFQFKLKEFWSHINGSFLLTLVVGIGASLISLAKVIHNLLDKKEGHPILVWSFFFGLIIISAILVARDIEKKDWKALVAGIAGVLIAYLITTISPSHTPETWWFVLISGAIAICAMILPGISGAFILFMLGKYEFIIHALETMDIAIIAIFALGCIIGILSFSRLISWFLKNYQSITVSILAGFMIGSLNKVWPWKVVDSFRMNSKGEQVPLFEHNVLPQQFLNETGQDPQLMQAILMMSLGIFVVVAIEKIASMFNVNKVSK
jgi:putative membrane protein